MKNIKTKLPLLPGLLAAMLGGPLAGASCTISAGQVMFSPYIGNQVDSTGVLTVDCTDTTSAVVTIDPGRGAGATDASRKMTGTDAGNSGATLDYNLYQDNARTRGFGSTALSGYSVLGSGNPELITVYGRIPANQKPLAGSYSDTLTVTVTY